MAEFDDVWALKKLKKKVKLPLHSFSSIFHKKWTIDKESDLLKEILGPPEI